MLIRLTMYGAVCLLVLLIKKYYNCTYLILLIIYYAQGFTQWSVTS